MTQVKQIYTDKKLKICVYPFDQCYLCSDIKNQCLSVQSVLSAFYFLFGTLVNREWNTGRRGDTLIVLIFADKTFIARR
mgnify:FL=1